MKKIKTLLLCLTMGLLLAQFAAAGPAVQAAPANPAPVEVLQPDGAAITVTNYGDEFFHWTEDEEGYLVAYEPDSQSWRYAYVEGDDILPGPVNAGEQPEARTRTAVQKVEADDYSEQFAEIAQAKREVFAVPGNMVPDHAAPGEEGPDTAPPAQAPVQADQKTLLLLFEFNNATIYKGDQYWYNTYFNEAVNSASVSRYYMDMANGVNIINPVNTSSIVSSSSQTISHPSSDVSWVASGTSVTVTNTGYQGVIRIKLGRNHPIPSWNDAGFNATRGMITLAVKAIKSNNPSFNFDGVKVCSIFAGGEAASGTLTNEVWAHQWYYDGTAAGLSGWIHYMANGEMVSSTVESGYGIMCHEFGHMLDLPDLYQGSGSGDVGPYSLMANGCYGYAPNTGYNSGTMPVALDPWSKIDLGYITPITVSADSGWTGNISRYDTGSYNILKVVSSVDPTQYFLIDNRGQVGYDAGLNRYVGSGRKGGIMIYHINDNVRGNGNANRRNVAVEAADGSTISTYASSNNHFFSTDLFNGRVLNRFNPTTAPNSNFNNASSPYTQNVASSIKIEVLDAPGPVMTVQVGDVTNPGQDNAAIAAAKTLLESTAYTAAQASASNIAQAKTAVEAIIGGLNLNGVTATVNDGTFTAAIAGTENDPDGTNGSYTFTVYLSRGAGTPVTTTVLTLTVTAGNYSSVSFPISIKAAKVDSTLGYGTWMKANLTTAFPPCTWVGDSRSGMPPLYSATMSITEPGTYYFILAGVSRWSYDSTCKAIKVIVDADGNTTVQGYNISVTSLGSQNDSAKLSINPNDPDVLVVSWGGIPAGHIPK